MSARLLSCAGSPALAAARRRRAARCAVVHVSGSAGASSGAVPAWRGGAPASSSLPLLPSGLPDYASIDALPQSKLLTATIRRLLVAEVGTDSDPRPWTSFDALLTSVRQVNDRPGSAQDVQAAARRVFQGILPALALGWVPAAWRAAVKPNFPPWLLHGSFFLVFYTLFPWLMGPLQGAEHAEVALPERWHPLLRKLGLSTVLRVPQAVKAERCRFLEGAQCASVCVNSCKVPTQEWMADDFGLQLHIQPNYSDFSCTWSFGKEAPPLHLDDALLVPCFSKCSSQDKGTKDASRQRARVARGVGIVNGVDSFTGETLEEIAARASQAALVDAAGVTPEDKLERAMAVQEQGKCWSVAEDRATCEV